MHYSIELIQFFSSDFKGDFAFIMIQNMIALNVCFIGFLIIYSEKAGVFLFHI